MVTTSARETVTVPEAVSRLGVDLRSTYERIQATGEIVEGVPVIRAGKRLLVPLRPLDRMLAGLPPEAPHDDD